MPSVLPPLIGRRVTTAIFNRLADPVIGFNVNLAAAVDEFRSLGVDLTAFEIDFSDETSNFLLGEISVDDLIQTSERTFPCITLFTFGSANKNLTKFSVFAGQIIAGLDVHLIHTPDAAVLQRDFESLAQAVESAMYQTINSGPAAVAMQVNDGVIYDGGMSCDKRALRAASDGWLQSLRFTLLSQVNY